MLASGEPGSLVGATSGMWSIRAASIARGVSAVSNSSRVPDQASAIPAAPSAERSAAASWAWRRSALLLSLAAQLVTISALQGADPPVASWPRMLLAIAPVPLAAVAALAPGRWPTPAAGVACAGLVIGIAGGWLPTGVLFLPALAAMAGAGVRARGEGP